MKHIVKNALDLNQRRVKACTMAIMRASAERDEATLSYWVTQLETAVKKKNKILKRFSSSF